MTLSVPRRLDTTGLRQNSPQMRVFWPCGCRNVEVEEEPTITRDSVGRIRPDAEAG